MGRMFQVLSFALGLSLVAQHHAGAADNSILSLPDSAFSSVNQLIEAQVASPTMTTMAGQIAYLRDQHLAPDARLSFALNWVAANAYLSASSVQAQNLRKENRDSPEYQEYATWSQ